MDWFSQLMVFARLTNARSGLMVGGIIGPIMAGRIRDVWQNWLAAFIICGIACLLAAAIALILKSPRLKLSAEN